MRPNDADGFTLVELLVATVLLAILATALYSGVRSIVRLHDKTFDLSELHRGIDASVRSLGDDIINSGLCSEFTFDPDSNMITFETLESRRSEDRSSFLAPVRVGYKALTSDNRVVLLRLAATHDSLVDTAVFRFPEGYTLRFSNGADSAADSLDFQEGRVMESLTFEILKAPVTGRGTSLVYQKRFLMGGLK